MDSGLNRNSGIFVNNFYEPILRPNATEKELVVVSKLTSTFFGISIILVALFIYSLKGLSLFDTMMYVGALIGFPMTIPAFCGFFIKKTPDWAGWGTLIVGGIVYYFVGFIITPEMVQNLCNLEPLSEERQKNVDKFFENLATPLVAESTEQKKFDNKQRRMLGSLIAVAGVGVMAMFFLPNPLWGFVAPLFSRLAYWLSKRLIKASKKRITAKRSCKTNLSYASVHPAVFYLWFPLLMTMNKTLISSVIAASLSVIAL